MFICRLYIFLNLKTLLQFNLAPMESEKDADGKPVLKDGSKILKRNKEKGKEIAKKRLEMLFTILRAMKYDVYQLVWDAQKAGKLRDLFEDTLAFNFALYYKANPDIFNECDILSGGECLNGEINDIDNKTNKMVTKMVKLKTVEQSQTALSFVRMIRHDIDVQGVKKILEKVIAKKVPQELADLDLRESLDKAKALIESNALKGDVKRDS